MRTLTYSVSFLTPAFLGDAEKSGRWRVPPFKAQVRQWWRVAYAADHDFEVEIDEMRRQEGLLFGNAWLDGNFCKSLVRIRLGRWDIGSMQCGQWPNDPKVTHPEVQGQQVGSALYLGYGPLNFNKQRRGKGIESNAAIQVGESARLSFALPQAIGNDKLDGLLHDNAPRLKRALWMMDRYGTIGGRSRNGWGSFALTPTEGSPELVEQAPARLWGDCLNRDWPHAIGRDAKGALVWQTKHASDWREIMKRLAELKIGLRTQFEFSTGKNAPFPEQRHWLSYPVTNHSVMSWEQLRLRLPNTLRFKVRRVSDTAIVGTIFHVPHMPPSAFSAKRETIVDVWRQVHGFLDSSQSLTRVAY
jgi:CRISPR-associated protein Cmr1